MGSWFWGIRSTPWSDHGQTCLPQSGPRSERHQGVLFQKFSFLVSLVVAVKWWFNEDLTIISGNDNSSSKRKLKKFPATMKEIENRRKDSSVGMHIWIDSLFIYIKRYSSAFAHMHHKPPSQKFHITRSAFCFLHKILHKLLSTIPKCIWKQQFMQKFCEENKIHCWSYESHHFWSSCLPPLQSEIMCEGFLSNISFHSHVK